MATWNTAFNTSPAGTARAKTGAGDIRLTRSEYYIRKVKEHEVASTSCIHSEGSARGYYQATAPTLRPDAATTLSTNDDGRLWFDSVTKTANIYNGTTFSNMYSVAGEDFHLYSNTTFYKASDISSFALLQHYVCDFPWNMSSFSTIIFRASTITSQGDFYFDDAVVINDSQTVGYSFIARDGLASSNSFFETRPYSSYDFFQFDQSNVDPTNIFQNGQYTSTTNSRIYFYFRKTKVG